MVARRARIIQFFAPLAVSANPRLDLLRAGLLDIPLLLRFVEPACALVPLFLPVGQCRFGTLQRFGRGLLGVLRLLEAGDEFVERQLELRNLRLVLVDVLNNLPGSLDCLLQIFLLPLAELIGVLDRLFKPGYFGPNFVVAALDLVEQVRPLRLPRPGIFDACFKLPLACHLFFEARLALVKVRTGRARLFVEMMGAECQQFGRRASLLVLVSAVALRCLRLSVEVLDVLFDLLQDVLQPVQVLPGMPYSV